MNNTGWWILGGVGLYLGFESYKNGINDLVIALDGFEQPGDGSIQVRLKITNPSRFFGYPVPKMVVNAYDASGTFLGTITNTQPQYIPANQVSYIYGVISPNLNDLITTIVDIIANGLQSTSNLILQGDIEIGSILIPFSTKTGALIHGPKYYDPGLNV